MADLKKRATIPAQWEKDGSIKLPSWGLETILKIAAGQVLGGPVGAAVALASECLSSPNVVQSSEVLYNLTGAVNHAIQALSATDDLVTENEKDVLNKIALVLGYLGAGGEAALPATAAAKRLEEAIVLHKAAMGEVVGSGEGAVYAPFLKKIAEKKTELWTVEITMTSFPQNMVIGEFSDGNKAVLKCGEFAWKFGNHVLERQFVQFTKFRAIAPFPGIKDYTLNKWEDVDWVVQLKKFEPPPDPPANP